MCIKILNICRWSSIAELGEAESPEDSRITISVVCKGLEIEGYGYGKNGRALILR